MRVAKTVILAITVLVLGAYALLDRTGILSNWFNKPAPELLRPHLEQLTGFTITNPGGAIRVTREGEVWRVVEPFEDTADTEWAVNTMNKLGEMVVTKVIGAEIDHTGLGFGPSETTTIAIHYGDTPGPRYQIGGHGPRPGTTYVMSEGVVFLAVGDLEETRTIVPEELIDPVLTRFDPQRIRAVDLKFGDQPPIELRRKAATALWRVKQPYTHSADHDKVNQWLNRWSTIELLGPLPRAKADTLLPTSGPDICSIKIEGEEPQSAFTIQLRSNTTDPDKAYVRISDRPMVYETSSTILETCPEDPETLRESRLLRVMSADVEGIAIAAPGRDPVRLRQHGTTWAFETTDNSVGELVNPEQPERLFKLLSETEVSQYLTTGIEDLSRFGLAEPSVTVQLEGYDLGPDEAKRVVMNIGDTGGLAFVAFEGLPFVAQVSRTFLTGIEQLVDPLRWKKLTVLNIAYPTVREIAITKADGTLLSVNLDVLNEDQAKRLRAFEGDKDITDDVDRTAVLTLVYLLGGLSAERWLQPLPEVTTALDEPKVVINITSVLDDNDDPDDDATTKRWTLRFAPTVRNIARPAFYYGRLEGDDAMPFLLKAETFDKLSGENLVLEAP